MATTSVRRRAGRHDDCGDVRVRPLSLQCGPQGLIVECKVIHEEDPIGAQRAPHRLDLSLQRRARGTTALTQAKVSVDPRRRLDDPDRIRTDDSVGFRDDRAEPVSPRTRWPQPNDITAGTRLDRPQSARPAGPGRAREPQHVTTVGVG